MTPSSAIRTFAGLVVGGLIGGCAPRVSVEDLQAMRPQRPPQLETLSPFVGRWEWEATATISGLDRTLEFTGQRDTRWEGDGWYLVSRETGSTEALGESRGISIWSYDRLSGDFVTTWVDSMGTFMTGTATFSERTDTWRLRATSRSPFGTTLGRGTVRFPDPDTMEWTWIEYTRAGLARTMEMTGVCRRTD